MATPGQPGTFAVCATVMAVLKRMWSVSRWVLVVLPVLVVSSWVFQSPLVRWAVERYGPEYTGRQITLEKFRFNPFTGTVRLGGLKVMEAHGDTTFVEVHGILVDLTLYKMVAGTVEVTALHVDRPFVRIMQHGNVFNFTDLVDRFAGDTLVDPDPAGDPVQWAAHDLRVDSAVIAYHSDLLTAPLRVVRLDGSCPIMAWDRSMIDATAKAELSGGTRVSAVFAYDLEAARYDVQAEVKDVPIRYLKPYVEPYMTISALEGIFRTNLHVKGELADPLAIHLSGRLGLDKMYMTDPKGVKLVGVEHMELVVDTIDVKKQVYRIRRFTAEQPYAFFELYDDGDNFTRLLPPDTVGQAEEELGYDPMNPFSMLAYYVKLVAEEYTHASYRVDSLGIVDGTVLFNDYTLYETFKYELSDVDLSADAINSNLDSITFRAHADLNRTGTFDGLLAIDPYSTRNMHLQYTIDRMGMSDLGPYTVFFVAHPILDGRTRYTCNTTVVDNQLHSTNNILIEDFQFGRKMEVKDAFDLPVRLAVSLLKDKNGDIKLDLPVEGDLDDPEYRVWPVIWQVLKNLVIKVVSAPVTMLARAFDADEEDLRSVRYLHLQEEVTSIQRKPLDILSRVLKEKPELHIELVRTGDRAAEAEAYAMMMAKAAYLADSLGVVLPTTTLELEPLVRDLDVRSPGFTLWLNGKLGGAGAGDPVQKQCLRYVGAERANAEVDRLWASRNSGVQSYLTTDRQLSAGAFTLRDLTPQDTIANSTQPSFQVVYGIQDAGAAAASAPQGQ